MYILLLLFGRYTLYILCDVCMLALIYITFIRSDDSGVCLPHEINKSRELEPKEIRNSNIGTELHNSYFQPTPIFSLVAFALSKTDVLTVNASFSRKAKILLLTKCS